MNFQLFWQIWSQCLAHGIQFSCFRHFLSFRSGSAPLFSFLFRFLLRPCTSVSDERNKGYPRFSANRIKVCSTAVLSVSPAGRVSKLSTKNAFKCLHWFFVLYFESQRAPTRQVWSSFPAMPAWGTRLACTTLYQWLIRSFICKNFCKSVESNKAFEDESDCKIAAHYDQKHCFHLCLSLWQVTAYSAYLLHSSSLRPWS